MLNNASLGEGVREAVAGGAGLDDVPAEGEPVDDGGAQPGVGEGLGPAGERLVGGDSNGVVGCGIRDTRGRGAGGLGVLVEGIPRPSGTPAGSFSSLSCQSLI